jgi:hypothetical protein
MFAAERQSCLKAEDALFQMAHPFLVSGPAIQEDASLSLTI